MKEEINNYQKKSEEINVVLIDAPILLDGNNNFYERKQYIENVKINYTNLKKLNKGKSALLVYPIRVENNNLYIIIETIIVNKKRIEVTRKNTYYFYYNCGEKKYKLDNKIDFQ
ncbi:hypothetical protein [Moheibacter sediminis]|uniref:hypothetical protein n=1 Tax=Moheibacter sediminis TaxID=1434700 RepID=UPI00117CBBB6|nr:hypothetical protein [Moheibacter sediminis]